MNDKYASMICAQGHINQAGDTFCGVCGSPLGEDVTEEVVVAETPKRLSVDEWQQQFKIANHREPTLAEYQMALEAGEVSQTKKPRDPALDQMVGGVKQVGTAAKAYAVSHVAPVATSAVRSVSGLIGAYDEDAGQFDQFSYRGNNKSFGIRPTLAGGPKRVFALGLVVLAIMGAAVWTHNSNAVADPASSAAVSATFHQQSADSLKDLGTDDEGSVGSHSDKGDVLNRRLFYEIYNTHCVVQQGYKLCSTGLVYKPSSNPIIAKCIDDELNALDSGAVPVPDYGLEKYRAQRINDAFDSVKELWNLPWMVEKADETLWLHLASIETEFAVPVINGVITDCTNNWNWYVEHQICPPGTREMTKNELTENGLNHFACKILN